VALIVQKYGGTSVGSTDRIRNVAKRVARFHRQGHQLVVVVSAMAGETNRLLALTKELSANPDPREVDVVAATGEQVTIGLLAIALKDLKLLFRVKAAWFFTLCWPLIVAVIFGSLFGGIGVSGAPGGDADDACAQAGIKAISDDLELG
jgi:aspartokinase